MLKTKAKAKAKASAKISKEGKVTVNMRIKKEKAAVSSKNAINKTDKIITYKNKQSRTQIFKTIANNLEVSKVLVDKVFNELGKVIEGHLSKKGIGEVTIPKVGIKLRRIKKKATKERTMVSPLTGQEVLIKAKPARLIVKLTALKSLKQIVNK